MEWVFPLSPVAASRPRVGRWGTYYTGTYKDFRESVGPLIREVVGDWTPLSGPLSVEVGIFPAKPKTTKLDFPRPDIDNYVKSIFDSCNGVLWEDDMQIVRVVAGKGWAEDDGYFWIKLEKLDG